MRVLLLALLLCSTSLFAQNQSVQTQFIEQLGREILVALHTQKYTITNTLSNTLDYI